MGTLFFSVSKALIDFGARRVPISAVRTLATTGTGNVRVFVSAKHPHIVVGGLSTLRRQGLVSNCVAVGNTCYFMRSAIVCGDPVPATRISTLATFYRRHGVPYVLIKRRSVYIGRPNRMIRRVFRHRLGISPVRTGPCASDRTSGTFFRLAPFVGTRRRTVVLPTIPRYRVNH